MKRYAFFWAQVHFETEESDGGVTLKGINPEDLKRVQMVSAKGFELKGVTAPANLVGPPTVVLFFQRPLKEKTVAGGLGGGGTG